MNATNSRTQQQATPVAKTKATRHVSDNVKAAKAADKLTSLDIAEAAELAATPEQIRQSYAKKRDAVLADLNETQKEGALALVNSRKAKAEMAQKSAAE